MKNNRKPRILNVDDDDAGRYIITRILQQAGFEVQEAATGRDALRLAEECPDLILLDVNLPDISGLEVCRQIRANRRTAAIPVVHLSATFVGGDDRAAGLEQGADGYLTQPVEPKVLVATINAFLRLKAVENALRESEEHLKEVQRVGHLGSWDLNVVTGDLQWSAECYRIYGFRPQEFVPTYEKFRSIVHPEDLGFVQEQVDAALNNGKHYDVNFRFVRPNGEIGWIHCEGEVIRDAEGKPLRFFGTQIDITERKRAEEKIQASLLEKETMLKEIHHRVKNNLQVVSSLLGLQSSYLQDEKSREIFQKSQDRVRIMANIHTMLYQSEDLARVDCGVFIRDLVGRLRQSYGIAESPVDVHVVTSAVSLAIETSVPCGLILNELVSNALKHAFPEGRRGEINISMQSEGNQMVLKVQDNGIGFPAAVDFLNPRSLGLELVRLLVGQINGTIDLQVEGGTTFTITFSAVR